MIIKGKKIAHGCPVLCVSVCDKTKDEILARTKTLSSRKINAIEWRADCFEEVADSGAVLGVLDAMKNIVQDKILIFTVRTVSEGGNADLGEEDYQRVLLAAAAHEATDLTDCEIEKVASAQTFFEELRLAGTPVIASYHDFQKTPDLKEIKDRFLAMKKAGADIAKSAYMPKNLSDVYHLMEACSALHHEDPEYPLIAISMGEMGAITRLNAEYIGSCLTFAAQKKRNAAGKAGSAPGQMDYHEVLKVLDEIHKVKHADQKIYFTGFMGTGKTSVSKKLCHYSRCRWIDTDKEIEEAAGKKISEIFADEGEEYFRKLETKTLQKIADTPGRYVVSCGGGLPMRKENIDIMRKSGIVVLLDASPETVLSHVSRSNSRPLLEGNMNLDYITGLMDGRRPYYEEAADEIIMTDGKGVEELAKMLKNKYF